MKRNRKVKIVATLGPVSMDESMIEKLYCSGADVFRINMSHTSHELLQKLVANIRAVEKRQKRPIGILIDLQGPKLRVGKFAQGKVALTIGQDFILDRCEDLGDERRVFLPHPEIFAAVQVGHRLLIDDGRLELLVKEIQDSALICEVVAGQAISDRKGVSLPDTVLGVGAMTPKDRADLEAALGLPIDWVALSFIQRPEDIADVRQVVRGKVAVLAKIEKPQAVERLEEIVEAADAIMVARGDLGVEMPLETVPSIQMEIIKLCRGAGKPVVVATQMLESMINAPVPTRAEVSDVATAVYAGADAVMLSAESAAGAYPEQAVQTMDRIATHIECDHNYHVMMQAQHPEPEPTGADAISLAARSIAQTLNLAVIVAYTASGTTGVRASRERPLTPIIALSPVVETARRLSLVWGLHCVVSADAHDLDDMVDRAARIAFTEGFCTAGERIIITAGVPLGTPGATNMLRIAYIAQDGKSGV